MTSPTPASMKVEELSKNFFEKKSNFRLRKSAIFYREAAFSAKKGRKGPFFADLESLLDSQVEKRDLKRPSRAPKLAFPFPFFFIFLYKNIKCW